MKIGAYRAAKAGVPGTEEFRVLGWKAGVPGTEEFRVLGWKAGVPGTQEFRVLGWKAAPFQSKLRIFISETLH